MSDADILLLQQMDTSLTRIALYIAGFDEDLFVDDQRTVDAVAMNLLVTGECVNRLAPELKVATGAPWPGVVNLRHRLAHAYATVAPEILWGIAETHAPKLHREVILMLQAR